MLRALLAVASLLAVAVPAAASPDSVVGGKETERDWPFMAYVELGRQEIEPDDSQICGGSLIAPTWVITAAHCILAPEAVQPLIMDVVIGRHRISDMGSGERIQAKRIIVNPRYGSDGEDSALIELERAPQTPRPIKIGAAGDEPAWAPGVMATVLGWGATRSGGSGSDALKEAQVPITTDEYCGNAYSDPGWGWNPAIMICAGYPEGGTDTCQGDSGGPLLIETPLGEQRLVGLTSFGEGCAEPGYPGVYAEAAGERIRSWIAGHVPEAIAPLPPPPPPAAPAPQQAPPPAAAPPASAPASQSRPSTKRPSKRVRARKAARKRALKRCLRKAKTRKAKRRCQRRYRARR